MVDLSVSSGSLWHIYTQAPAEGSNLNDEILRLQLLPCLSRHDALQGFGDRDVAHWRCEEAPGPSHQYATRITTTLGASTNQISSQLKLLSIAISSHRHHSPSVVSHTSARLIQCPSFLWTHCFFCIYDQLLSKNRDSTPSRAQSDLLVKEYSGQSHNSLADSFRSEVVKPQTIAQRKFCSFLSSSSRLNAIGFVDTGPKFENSRTTLTT